MRLPQALIHPCTSSFPPYLPTSAEQWGLHKQRRNDTASAGIWVARETGEWGCDLGCGYVFCDGLHWRSRTTEKQNVSQIPSQLAPGCHAHSWSIKARFQSWHELLGRASRQIRKPERGMLWIGRGSRDEAHGGDRKGGPHGKHTAPEGRGRAPWALRTGAACVHQPWPSDLRQAYDWPTHWLVTEESSEKWKKRKTTQNKTGVGREKHQSQRGHKLPLTGVPAQKRERWHRCGLSQAPSGPGSHNHTTSWESQVAFFPPQGREMWDKATNDGPFRSRCSRWQGGSLRWLDSSPGRLPLRPTPHPSLPEPLSDDSSVRLLPLVRLHPYNRLLPCQAPLPCQTPPPGRLHPLIRLQHRFDSAPLSDSCPISLLSPGSGLPLAPAAGCGTPTDFSPRGGHNCFPKGLAPEEKTSPE